MAIAQLLTKKDFYTEILTDKIRTIIIYENHSVYEHLANTHEILKQVAHSGLPFRFFTESLYAKDTNTLYKLSREKREEWLENKCKDSYAELGRDFLFPMFKTLLSSKGTIVGIFDEEAPENHLRSNGLDIMSRGLGHYPSALKHSIRIAHVRQGNLEENIISKEGVVKIQLNSKLFI